MRPALALPVIGLVLTSCTGSPTTQKMPGPSAPVSVTPGTSAPVSLPCGSGAQKRVVGARHLIRGEIFGRPLMAPPARDHTNKILWSARNSGEGDLIVTASLNGDDLRVRRRVAGGPGPSIINLPKAGCWTFVLRWPGSHDLVAVRYIRSR